MTYTLSRWDLSDLFSDRDGEDMQAAFYELERRTTAFESSREQLSPKISVQEFLMLVKDLEAIERLAHQVSSFASLSFAADTQDQAAQAFVARVDQVLTALQNRSLFFELWWKDLDEAAARTLLEASGDNSYWLEQMRQFKPHTLSEPEEKVINLKNVTGVKALNRLYDSITNRYAFNLTVDGQAQELTRGELMTFARSHDPALREGAYRELYRVYGQDGPILGQIYQTLVQDWRGEQVELRRFAAPIAARNLANDIPDPVVDILLQVCERNAGVFQHFFHLKARWLGVERLRRYDIYAPVYKSDKNYDFNQAAGLVLESFNEFDPQLAELARGVFDQHHLDSEVRKGKRGGAFCSTVTPDLSPWVLVNYQGKAEDVSTLAHELGHAVHSLLASGHSIFTQHASLPLAETASTFGEMLLTDRLLAGESDTGVRRDLLFSQVDDAYVTILRQAYFALFERKAHDMILAGATVDELSDAYLENLRSQFGEAVELSDEFRWEWVSIPHIYHVPFYVYAYTFGQLLVLALYRQYKIEGQAFKPRYLKILEAGGSEAPASILSKAGIDIYRADFWQGGFDVVNDLVGQLEALPAV